VGAELGPPKGELSKPKSFPEDFADDADEDTEVNDEGLEFEGSEGAVDGGTSWAGDCAGGGAACHGELVSRKKTKKYVAAIG
jgi:hypothetical protein